jgi:DNA-binding transcriptional ArsR family regulator
MKDGLQIEEMKNAADSVVGTLKSLANTDRLLILCHLAHEELNVSQIEEKTQITQPTLSQQLMMLRKSDVVSTVVMVSKSSIRSRMIRCIQF